MLPIFELFASIIFYVLSGLAVFQEPLIYKIGSIQWDAVSVHFFNLFFSSETWRNGIFPLWSPYIFAGFPQIADLQVAFFYPINLLISLFAVFTPELVMYQIILHYFIACFFTFLLSRHLSNNLFFSLAAGIVYAFGGFMVGHASHVGMQNTATWLPLIFLLLIMAYEKYKIVYAALCGLFLGIAILAGHFQMSLYIAYAIAFYFIFDVIWGFAESFKEIDKNPATVLFKKIGLISIVYIIAFLISAIQLLPTYELTQLSNRAKISLEMSQTESLNPESLRSLIEPNFNNVAYGSPYLGPWDRTQNYLYIGIAILILAILGFLSAIYRRNSRKMTFFWFLLLTTSLLYSFGNFGILHKYFYLFAPFFDKVRAPSNMMLLFNLSIIGLASSLFKNIGESLKKFNDLSKIDNPHSLHAILRIFKNTLLNNAAIFLGTISLLIIAFEILPAAFMANSLLYSREKITEITASAPIVAKIEEEYSRLNIIDKFKTFRLPSLDRNLSQVLHVFAFDGYNPLSLRRHSNYVDTMVKNPALIDLAGIKYLPCEFIPDRANYLEKTGTLCINQNYSKLAFLADDIIVAKNEADVLKQIQAVDLKKIIILEEAPPDKTKSNSKNDLSEIIDKLSITAFEPGFWNLNAQTNKETFLFINQANYPGWTAKIDGKPSKIYQADYLFQAILIPSGKHEIILKFESRPLIIGEILTIIGLSSVLLIVAFHAFRQRKNIKRND